MGTPVRSAGAVACALAFSTLGAPAAAATIIKDPNPPKYSVEIEPHLNVQYFYATYGAHGFGPGVRFGIPIVSPGFIKTINNSVAISFGADIFYLQPNEKRFCDRAGCYDYEGKGFWALYSPVTMQWNFWITEKWSAFGEPGVVLRTLVSEDSACDRKWGCKTNDSFVWWSFYAGARFHFSDRMALTLRAGYPTGVSVGLSIF